MDRRDFLYRTACMATAAVATPSLHRLALADNLQQTRWTMRLSTSSIEFSFLSVEKACEQIAALGFEAVDFWNSRFKCPHLDEIEKRLGPEGLKELLARCKLKLLAFSYLPDYPRYAELLGKAGGGLVICGTPPSKVPNLTAEMRAFLEKLKPQVELAEKNNSTIAVENHGGNLLNTLDSFKAFVDLNRNPRLGLALAPFHLQVLGASVEEAIEIADDQLFFFYAWQHADLKKDPNDLTQLPGIGPTDFTPWIGALAKIDYRGYVNPFMHGRPPTDVMVKSLATSRDYLKKCYLDATIDKSVVSLPSKRGRDTLSIFRGGRPVLRYRYRGVAFKPYVDQLFSPSGVQVLRDSAPDHKHHHGLMYALSVDGVNFWEEATRQAGTEKHRRLKEINDCPIDGLWRSGFVEDVDWIETVTGRQLMVERRQIEVLEDRGLSAPGDDPTLVDWRCRLATPPGKEKVTLTGHHYFGLGMRFVPSMDKGGRFFNADDRPGEDGPDHSRLTRTRWCAYTAKADGKPVTVALFDHPSNLRHPQTMFTLARTFAYLSATINEWREPVTVTAGHPLDLCYGVAVWDGDVDKATVEKLYQRWAGLPQRHEGTKE